MPTATKVKLPTRKAMVGRLGSQPDAWVGRCHEVSVALTQAMDAIGQPAIVRRGWFRGETVEGAYFYGRPCQHSWVELPDGRVCDPTRHAFAGGEGWPLWVGPDDDYDICGCRGQAPSSPPSYASASTRPLMDLRFAEDGDDSARGIVQRVAWLTGIGGYCAKITARTLVISIEQAFWLANLPIKDVPELGVLPAELAGEVYSALIRSGRSEAIPIDRRDWILGDGGALYGRDA